MLVSGCRTALLRLAQLGRVLNTYFLPCCLSTYMLRAKTAPGSMTRRAPGSNLYVYSLPPVLWSTTPPVVPATLPLKFPAKVSTPPLKKLREDHHSVVGGLFSLHGVCMWAVPVDSHNPAAALGCAIAVVIFPQRHLQAHKQTVVLGAFRVACRLVAGL